MTDFLNYIEQKVNLTDTVNRIRETRKRGKAGIGTIVKSLIISFSLGSGSVRQSDQMMKQEQLSRKLSDKLSRICSDTTMFRVIGKMDVGITEGLLEKINHQMGRAHSRTAIGTKRLRVGIVDGTVMGGQFGSVVMMPGEIERYLGFKIIPQRGKELLTSLSLLRELAGRYGKKFIEVLLGDGLHATTSFFETCQEVGSAGIVKTDDQRLIIIQEANDIFDYQKGYTQQEYSEGIDTTRLCTYKTWAINNRQWINTGIYLKICRVEETYIKGCRRGQTIRFWVLSQRQDLSCTELRELGHRRWAIENEGFRSLNQENHTKHMFSHDGQTAASFSRLQLIAAMIINSYRLWLEQFKEHLRKFWDHGTFPLASLRTCLLVSLNLNETNTS